jgi:succinate-semialdehyde dehydrogenase / glutarate-semialdehyde dehydrogenase
VADAGCYIGGSWVRTDRTFAVTDPADGSVVGHAADADAATAAAAVEAAHTAFAGWAATPAAERGAALRRISAALLADLDRIADLIVAEQGKPRGQALFEVRYATQWLDWFAEEGRRVYGEIIPPSVPNKRLYVQKKPLGVAVAITPWNFPLAMITRKLGPALAAGNTMVVKPAEETPLSALALGELAVEAGVPAGVINIVTGDPVAIGEELLANPIVRMLSFTGSTETGKLLVRRSADTLPGSRSSSAARRRSSCSTTPTSTPRSRVCSPPSSR